MCLRTIKKGESHSSLESPSCVVISARFQVLSSPQYLDGCLPPSLPSAYLLSLISIFNPSLLFSLISIFNPSLLLLPRLSYAPFPSASDEPLSRNECIHSFNVYCISTSCSLMSNSASPLGKLPVQRLQGRIKVTMGYIWSAWSSTLTYRA